MGGSGTWPTPFVLGLTGPIGCGKTTVGDLLLELGAGERIDADREVHLLMQPETAVTAAIAAAFGQQMLNDDGAVNRRHLAEVVFAEPSHLERLESIVHPAVREAIRDRLRRHAEERCVVVVDAVKLLQSDLLALTDGVWLVNCRAEVQRDRLRRIRGMEEAAVEGRLRAQPEFTHPRVTRRIDNSGSLEQLRFQVEQGWREFASRGR